VALTFEFLPAALVHFFAGLELLTAGEQIITQRVQFGAFGAVSLVGLVDFAPERVETLGLFLLAPLGGILGPSLFFELCLLIATPGLVFGEILAHPVDLAEVFVEAFAVGF